MRLITKNENSSVIQPCTLMQRQRGPYTEERRHLTVLCSSVAAAGILNADIFSKDRGRGRQEERETERSSPADWPIQVCVGHLYF